MVFYFQGLARTHLVQMCPLLLLCHPCLCFRPALSWNSPHGACLDSICHFCRSNLHFLSWTSWIVQKREEIHSILFFGYFLFHFVGNHRHWTQCLSRWSCVGCHFITLYFGTGKNFYKKLFKFYQICFRLPFFSSTSFVKPFQPQNGW